MLPVSALDWRMSRPAGDTASELRKTCIANSKRQYAQQRRTIMHQRRSDKWFLMAALASISAALALNPPAFAQQQEPNAQQPNGQSGTEVLTRGPVHEAFAEVVSFTPESGAIAPKAPPDPIEELPPDQKPEGPNVAWIPGYWSWDDERDDF